MRFSLPQADVYAPSGAEPAAALARTTHLCVAAHQDDIEIMAYQGIAACLGRADRSFTGVIVTDGGGSPRSGRYARVSDEEMRAIRRREQRRAARLGRYGLQIQLGYPSAAVKRPGRADLAADLRRIFAGCQPEVVYLHNPTDKHDTHVAVFLRCLEAIRTLPKARRPLQVLGCEVWRDLDWLPEAEKVLLDVSDRPPLARALLKVFRSQVEGGKRYDLATLGRRAAHATYQTTGATDATSALTLAMDLTVLARVDSLDVERFTLGLLQRFRDDVAARLRRLR